MRRVTNVRLPGGYGLELTFDDGVRGVVDLSDLAGKGVFSSTGKGAQSQQSLQKITRLE